MNINHPSIDHWADLQQLITNLATVTRVPQLGDTDRLYGLARSARQHA